jgi:membrane-associated HD superfamily phosphohydrolase
VKFDGHKIDDSDAITNLSFKDVRRTKAILYELLGNIYHARVAYPERVPIEP